MSRIFCEIAEINGEPASADDLRQLVQTNYGHFSAMQVSDGGVRGLDLHLQRLDQASWELFGVALDPQRMRGYLRHAIAGEDRPMSLRVNIFSRALDRNRLDLPAPVDVLVISGIPTTSPATPLRLKSFRYSRDLPAIKHVGTFPLFHYRRLAQQAGFDDAVFVDEQGRFSEGSIWNIGFLDAQGIVWPQAPQLNGVTQQLLQMGLARIGVSSTTRPIHLIDLADLRGTFFSNASVPVQPIAAIDDVEFCVNAAAIARLMQAYESNPIERV